MVLLYKIISQFEFTFVSDYLSHILSRCIKFVQRRAILPAIFLLSLFFSADLNLNTFEQCNLIEVCLFLLYG